MRKESKFENYLRTQIAPKGFNALVTSALAMLKEAERLLDAPWITRNWIAVRQAAEQWLECPCENHANLAFEEAKKKESRGDAADDASTDVGDWWSYEAVCEAHTLCEAIALHSGLPEANPNDPLGLDPSEAVIGVCVYFASFPSDVQRGFMRAKDVVDGA